MNAFRWVVYLVFVAMVGCSCSSRQPVVTDLLAEKITEPGPFLHSLLTPTIGPADGDATLLILSEKPITVNPILKELSGNHATIGFHGLPESLSGRTIRFTGGDLSNGWGFLKQDGRDVNFRIAVVRFETIRHGQPVVGDYDLTISDGTRILGKFTAEQRSVRHE